MLEQMQTAAFWLALGNIILVNVVLSGDNAIVIALAARKLPPIQQRRAIVLGSSAAIVLRIVLTIFALRLLTLPYLKIGGALLLLYIGMTLIGEDNAAPEVGRHTGLASAIRTILLADLVMSLDNVLGVAAAANGNLLLLVVGLAISIPLIVFGSGLLLKLVERLPIIVALGAALLGYLAGEMLFGDVALQEWIAVTIPRHAWQLPGTHRALSLPGIVGAVLALAGGRIMAFRGVKKSPLKERAEIHID